ncbi:MAG: precorrin-2 C(20)-methyltransferase [Clostridiaceae bacterium]|nr:precorrin-2 C(20)-methyltransferase [Clostridiaceae bacterium]MBW4860824.1 precorrin-2 C(20)-methyltransferase [Clostridiaceae bacterium]MBW4867449.1 precorrin-2 C(20)-methyltransferase [Clostridiaceae bacterium]
MKKLFGIGTGPGDKEYLTLKAVRIMEEAEIIFAPNNNGKNMALDTAKDFIEGKRVVLIDFPMRKVKKEDYENAAEIIKKEIPEGKSGAFLTIGDPMVYSTFIYLMENVEEMGVEVEVVPGITSFLAGASKSKTPITVKGDKFLLLDEMKDEEILEKVDSVCILKTTKNKKTIIDTFEKKNFSYTYVKRCSLKEEQILMDKEDILEDKDYISFIFGRREKDD